MAVAAETLELLVELLMRSCARVAGEYFQLPVAEEDPLYRERVYCYELYHQLRLGWPVLPQLQRLTLSGEVDKRGHPLIRGPLLDLSKPDFLVHVPGDMEENALVIEVKPTNTTREHFAKDVRKVAAFLREPAQYAVGVCLLYGADADGDVEALLAAGRAALADNQDVADRLHLFRHATAGAEAYRVPW